MNNLSEYFEKELIETRRKFRKIAEPAWMEIQTTLEIIKYLKNLNYKIYYGKTIHTTRMGLPNKFELENHIKNLNLSKYDFEISDILQGYTGVIAEIKSENPGKTFCFRFDIDALPLEESMNPEHIPTKLNFRSQNKNFCHACGHDGHISIGLLLAKYIKENIHSLKGTYRFIFQPAEEGVRGAKSITNTKFLDNIDYFLSSHIGMGEKNKTLGIGTEGFLATAKYDVEFKGIASHAGNSPEKGKNALLCACSCTLNLHTIPQYGNGIARINVGTLEGGDGRNLIPQKAKLQLEIRSDKKDILDDLKIRTENIIKYSALSYDIKYKIEEVGSATTFVSKNKNFIDKLALSLEEQGFNIDKYPKFNGSEDVTYMLEKVETNGGIGIHFIFGTNLKAPHHNEAFDYDEDVLLFGLKAYTKTINYINKNN